jgi:hypothetical protein
MTEQRTSDFKTLSVNKIYTVASRLKPGISESERESITRQRLGNHVSCIIACETIKYVHVATRTLRDRYNENDSLNSGVPAVTNTLAAVISECRKLKDLTRCSLLGSRKIVLRRCRHR